MSSWNKDSFSEVIEKLSDWSDQEIQDNLEDTISVLLSVLKCPAEKSVSLKALQALLGKCLFYMPVDSMEETILQYALPSSDSLFKQAVEEIYMSLQGIDNTHDVKLLEKLNSLLQECIELLTCIGYPLQYMQSLGKTDSALVPSIPKVTASVLLESFKHCKESEKLYGSLFENVSEVLTALFQKSHELQLTYLAVLNENLEFNCMFEDELTLLTETLEVLGQIGQIVTRLDLKTMAEQWKGYARLALKYVEPLKPRLNIAEQLQFLAVDLSNNLEKILEIDPPDLAFTVRIAKIGSFMLKIIIKLCVEYSGYLCNCHQELLVMLLTMYKFSSPYLKMKNIDEEIIRNIEMHITIGADPLLKHLILEVEFAEKYFAYGSWFGEIQNNQLAFVFLSVSVLKKLIHSNEDERKLWMNNNIIQVFFRALDHCQAAMLWDIVIPGVSVNGEPEKNTDLYEYITTHVSGFILSASVHEFSTVEQALMESVLQSNVWRAMLAMDVWCIVARTGSSELCFQQLCHLIEVLKCLASHWSRPERAYLMVLVGRLFSLLSKKHQVNLVEMYQPDLEVFLWQALDVKVLPGNLKLSVMDKLIESAISHIEKFLSTPPTVQHYYEMVDLLLAVSQCSECFMPNLKVEVLTLTAYIVNLWHRVPLKIVTSHDATNTELHHICSFAIVLCSVTAALTMHMNNIQLIKVLGRLKEIASCDNSCVRVTFLTILKSLAKKVIDSTPDQMKVFQYIADLFSSILQDDNEIVRQQAFEVFVYFAHVNTHDSIITLSVKNNSLHQKTKQFLQKVPLKSSDYELLTYESYVLQLCQIRFCHQCKQDEHPVSSNVNEVVCSSVSVLKENQDSIQTQKKLKLSVTEERVSESIERLKQETCIIQNYCKTGNLSVTANQELIQISDHLRNLR